MTIISKLNIFRAVAFLLTVTGPVSVFQANAQGLRAGAAKVAITPQKSELALPTDVIRDQLYVRAVYVDNGTSCAVLASVDVGGVRNNVLEMALPKSSASTGCPIKNYVVSATHTHSSNTGGLGAGAPTAETIAAALVSAVDMAKSRLASARVGYGTTEVDLNVNRDNYNQWLEWRQEPNPKGVSDKTLSVLEFLGTDDVPIAVYMNYGMHPVNFYNSGVISADFPGDAALYIEKLFDDRTVALFSQAPSGDQNPQLAYASIFRDGPVKAVLPPHRTPNTGQGTPPPPAVQVELDPKDAQAAHIKTIERKNDYVQMLGTMIGTSAVKVMLYGMEPKEEALIWAGQQNVTCGGRVRIDNNGRENYDPGYEDGADINIKVGLLRIGDINMVSVDGEVYTEIGQRLKAESPASKTMLVTLANGSAGSGYIYSNAASHHLTFQVIGSRLQPGCAEEGIVSTALDLMKQAEK